MFCLLPIYRFSIITKYSPKIVKNKLTSLIKKDELSNKKVKFYIQGFNFGIEEFTGKVEENYFRLKRYRYFSKDPVFIIYKGRIEATETGSTLKLAFNYDLTITTIFVIMITILTINLINCISNGTSDTINSLLGISFITSIFYIISIIGFNYRINKVRDLFERKLK